MWLDSDGVVSAVRLPTGRVGGEDDSKELEPSLISVVMWLHTFTQVLYLNAPLRQKHLMTCCYESQLRVFAVSQLLLLFLIFGPPSQDALLMAYMINPGLIQKHPSCLPGLTFNTVNFLNVRNAGWFVDFLKYHEAEHPNLNSSSDVMTGIRLLLLLLIIIIRLPLLYGH